MMLSVCQLESTRRGVWMRHLLETNFSIPEAGNRIGSTRDCLPLMESEVLDAGLLIGYAASACRAGLLARHRKYV